jgi:hypothetical protein
MYFLAKRDHAPRFLATLISVEKVGIQSARSPSGRDGESEPPAAKPAVVPIFGIFAATIFAFLAFLPSQSPSAEQVSLNLSMPIDALNAVAQAFYWLSSMTAAAAMLSWIGMMVTYSESLFVSCALPSQSQLAKFVGMLVSNMPKPKIRTISRRITQSYLIDQFFNLS